MRPPTRSTDAHDRRRSPRRASEELRLRSPTLDVRVINHSREGLAIETAAALRIGSSYHFVAHEAGGDVRFEGRVLWCRLHRTERDRRGEVQAVFRAGIERAPSSS